MRYTCYMRPSSLLSLLLAGSLLVLAPTAHAAKNDSTSAPEAETLCQSLSKSAAKAGKAKGDKKAAKQAKGLKLLAGQIKKIAAGELDVNHQSKEGLSALMVATSLGHKGAVRWLIAQGADPKLADSKGKDSFSRSRKPELKELLEAGSQPGDKELIESILHSYVDAPQEETVQSILQKGVSVCALNQTLRLAFVKWDSDCRGYAQFMKQLLENGAKAQALLAPGKMAGLDPDKLPGRMHPDEDDYKLEDIHPMYTLIGNILWHLNSPQVKEYREVLDLLVEHGVEMKQLLNTVVDETSGSTQLMMAAASNIGTGYRDAGCIAWLLEHGADPEIKNKEGKTALDILTEYKDAGDEKFEPDIPGKKAMLGADSPAEVLNKALVEAARYGAASCVEKLLAKGADISALKVQASKYSGEVCGVKREQRSGTSGVFSAKRKPEYQYFYYKTNHPLYPMLRDFHSESSKHLRELLVEKAGDTLPEYLNVTAGGDDATLLMAAADVCAELDYTCPPEAVAWLLKHGADPHVKNKEGKTAYDITANEAKKKLLKAAMDKAGK